MKVKRRILLSFMFPNGQRGFTLIELLIAVAIIGILTVGILILINPLSKIKQARDSTRKGDIGNISRALDGFILANGRYPATLAELATYESGVVLKDPKDPEYKYVYTVDNSQSPPTYTLCAYLETQGGAWCVFSNQAAPSTLALGDPNIPQGLIGAPGSGPTPTVPQPLETPVPMNTPVPTPASPTELWYKFDETSGNIASDSSGSNKNGTLFGGAGWTAGQLSNAVNLNGSVQYITLPTGVVSGLNDFTIATWVNVSPLAPWARIFDFGTGTSANMFLIPTNGSAMRYAITVSGGGAEQRIDGPPLSPGWHHVAVTLSGTSGRLYVDGAQIAVNSSMTLKPSSLGNTNLNFIGKSQYSDPTLTGKIDDFRIYNRALSAAEISSFYIPSGPTPTSAPSESGWVTCATENWFCPFSGTRQVRFGANGFYAYQNRTDGVDCKTSVFGDPAWGYGKTCSYNLGTTPPLSSNYEAVPVIYLSSDSPIQDDNAYTTQVNASFQTVRTWYAGQLGGKTFNLAPAIFFKSSKTEAQIQTQYGYNLPNDTGIWRSALVEAVIANNMNPCDPKRFYYLVTNMDNIRGGMMGAEGFGCRTHVLPGTASIPSHMGRMLGGYVEPWPEWWADEIREAQGGVAHEFGHGFGGSCDGNNDIYGNCGALPHSSSPSIMYAWSAFPDAVFYEDEKQKVLASPFIH